MREFFKYAEGCIKQVWEDVSSKHKKQEVGMGQTNRAQSEMGRVESQPGRFMGWKTRFSLVTA